MVNQCNLVDTNMLVHQSQQIILYFDHMEMGGIIPLDRRDDNMKTDLLYTRLGNYKLQHDFSPHN